MITKRRCDICVAYDRCKLHDPKYIDCSTLIDEELRQRYINLHNVNKNVNTCEHM